MSLLAHHHARRLAALTGRPPLIWQEDNPAITYGNGSWVPFYPALAYGGSARYAITNGAAFEFAVPAGYSRCFIEGLRDENGSFFDVLRNESPVLNGNSFASPARQDVCAELPVAPGDIVRVVFNGQGLNNYGNGGNNAFYADQIRFT